MAAGGGAPEPEARRRLLEAVLDFPGLRAVDLARHVALSPSHVEYHLETLLDAELVVEATYDHRRFFPVPGPAAPALADAEWLALLREKVPLQVALVACGEGPVTHTTLHGHVGVAKSTLSFHLGKLVEVGILVRQDDGAYAPSDRDRLVRLLVRFRPVSDLLDATLHLWLPLYRDAGRPA